MAVRDRVERSSLAGAAVFRTACLSVGGTNQTWRMAEHRSPVLSHATGFRGRLEDPLRNHPWRRAPYSKRNPRGSHRFPDEPRHLPGLLSESNYVYLLSSKAIPSSKQSLFPGGADCWNHHFPSCKWHISSQIITAQTGHNQIRRYVAYRIVDPVERNRKINFAAIRTW